jgi:hypothetical protein
VSSLPRRLVLVGAAIAEVCVLIFTPRVVVLNGQRLTASQEGASAFAPSLDLTTIAGYTLGVVVIAALLWFALAPASLRG